MTSGDLVATGGAVCSSTISRYRPLAAINSSWRPCSRMCPFSITRIRLAWRIVLSRCAITKLVRPAISVLKRTLNEPLALGVEIACRFVEDQDSRIGEDRAGDRQSLTLTAGELHATLADAAVVLFVELLDEFVRVRQPRRLFDLRWCPRRVARTRCCRRSCRRTETCPARRCRVAGDSCRR